MKTQKHKRVKYLSQEKARFIFEELTDFLFLLTRKELDGRLELDGYCKELKIAFEYNGEQHYDPQHYYNLLQNKNDYDSQAIRDSKKRMLCAKKKITLIEIRHTNNTDYLEKDIRSRLLDLGICLARKKIIWSKFQERVDDFKKSATTLQNKNIILLTKAYLGSHSRHEFRCSKCHYIWKAVLKDVLYRSGCPMCAGSVKHSIEDVRKMAEKSKIILLSNVYTSMQKKHKFKCQKCKHIWHAKPNQIQQGQGCPKCSGNIMISFEQFSECIKSKKIKLLDKFTGMNQRYHFVCSTCKHTWFTVARNIWLKTGCPSCSNAKKRINIDQLKLLASKRNLKLLSIQCVGYCTAHLWMCISCGEKYKLKPCNVQRGTSCRQCKLKKKGREVNKECL